MLYSRAMERIYLCSNEGCTTHEYGNTVTVFGQLQLGDTQGAYYLFPGLVVCGECGYDAKLLNQAAE